MSFKWIQTFSLKILRRTLSGMWYEIREVLHITMHSIRRNGVCNSTAALSRFQFSKGFAMNNCNRRHRLLQAHSKRSLNVEIRLKKTSSGHLTLRIVQCLTPQLYKFKEKKTRIRLHFKLKLTTVTVNTCLCSIARFHFKFQNRFASEPNRYQQLFNETSFQTSRLSTDRFVAFWVMCHCFAKLCALLKIKASTY